jgi:2,3-bisphosphoglycerate-independent phosphoglycerate mutase
LTQAFIEPNFDYFPRDHTPQLGAFISLTAYSADYDIPVAFPPETLRNVFGEYISKFGLRQLRIAETEKYAHVTYFFDGGEERKFPGEDRILIPSPRVSTYDLKPEMSAYQITTRLVEAIDNRRYDAIICNFANADLVGHSGDFNATVKAVEAIDDCLGKIVDATQKVGGELLITADHGNAEQMRGFTTEKARGQPHTAHTSNPVPLIYVGRAADMLPTTGALSDIAPTMLHLMGLEKPAEMTGHNLVHLVEYPAEATIGN